MKTHILNSNLEYTTYDKKNQKSDKISMMGDWQLSQLALEDAFKKDIEIILLASKEENPSSLLINPSTGEPFIKKENTIIVPKLENWKPNWADERSMEAFMKLIPSWTPWTFEFENIPAENAELMEQNWYEVFPNSTVLRTIQDRSTEKAKINSLWGNTVPYTEVNNTNEIEKFIREYWPIENWFILKSRRDWYDWHWQTTIRNREDIQRAFDSLKEAKNNGWIIIEKMIDLDFEASVILSRDRHWNIRALAPSYNIHDWWILRTSITPAPINPEIEKKLIERATKLLENWPDYVWILTIEFFVWKGGEIFENELAPRTHNSGHATLDTWWTSQNELWLNTVSWRTTELVEWTRAVVMKNILMEDLLTYYRVYNNRKVLHPNYMKFYDYLKVKDETNDSTLPMFSTPHMFNDNPWVKPRKFWHVNIYNNEISRMIEAVREGRKDIWEFISNMNFYN